MDNGHLFYHQLLKVNKEAFDQELFAVAYHALSGAMYCASSLKDARKLAEVEQLARQQLQHITQHFSQHPALKDPLELSLYSSLVQIAYTRNLLFRE